MATNMRIKKGDLVQVLAGRTAASRGGSSRRARVTGA